MSYRVILYHKHPTSAKTVFFKFNDGSICAFEKLPTLAQIVKCSSETLQHPASILAETEQRLGLETGGLKAEGEYLQMVEVPGQRIQIILAGINSLDAPLPIAEKNNAEFIALTQARGLPDIELELLRHAYELILGG